MSDPAPDPVEALAATIYSKWIRTEHTSHGGELPCRACRVEDELRTLIRAHDSELEERVRREAIRGIDRLEALFLARGEEKDL